MLLAHGCVFGSSEKAAAQQAQDAVDNVRQMAEVKHQAVSARRTADAEIALRDQASVQNASAEGLKEQAIARHEAAATDMMSQIQVEQDMAKALPADALRSSNLMEAQWKGMEA